MAKQGEYSFERASFPEEVGVDSKEIKALIDELEGEDIEVHSIMVLRHNRVAYEAWRDPFNPLTPHTMYSVSKSFTSAAIGFAIDEGLITLDTKVIDIFPEYAPTVPDPKLEKMTVYHLLTMSAGKNVSLLDDKKKKDWIKSFFNAPWGYEPGQGWKYISENTYMCCCIISRLTGLTVREYLRTRLFEPLGYDRVPFWEEDHHGLEAGGWGLFITTEELARFVVCLQNNGVYAGRQVLPAWYVELATSNCVDNSPAADPNTEAGYGCFFWRCDVENTFRVDGMFGQYGIVFKDYDASFIITEAEIDQIKALRIILKHFPNAFIPEQETRPADAPESLELSPLPVLPARDHSPYEKLVEGHPYCFAKNPLLSAVGFPTSFLPLTVTYMSKAKGGNIDDLVFRFGKDECTVSWREGDDKNTVVCGMDGRYRICSAEIAGIPFTAVSSASWRTDKCLEVWIRPLESVAERRFVFEFEGNKVKAYPSSMPTLKKMAENLAEGVDQEIPNEFIAGIGRKLVLKLDKIVDFPMYGKMK